MTRLAWFISAVIVGMVGADLLARGWLGWTGWFVVGVGLGLASAVIGSLLHDALAGPGPRRP
jgi:hypothetical protein